MSDEIKWCPTKNGTFTGYEPEVRLVDIDGSASKWKRVPWSNKGRTGVPYPAAFGGILREINMLGYHQAMALAHWFGAGLEQGGDSLKGVLEVRAVPYEIIFNIKARKLDGKEDSKSED